MYISYIHIYISIFPCIHLIKDGLYNIQQPVGLLPLNWTIAVIASQRWTQLNLTSLSPLLSSPLLSSPLFSSLSLPPPRSPLRTRWASTIWRWPPSSWLCCSPGTSGPESASASRTSSWPASCRTPSSAARSGWGTGSRRSWINIHYFCVHCHVHYLSSQPWFPGFGDFSVFNVQWMYSC